MDITYDMIIKYLVTKKSIFASKKHITVYSDLFPTIFKDLLQNKFYRYGINQTDSNNNNISFYNSLLTLLNKHFITFTNTEELDEISNFKRELKELHNIINNIQDISETLQLNFLFFDFKNETINIIFCGNTCNPYIPTLLFANYDESFEPIMFETDNKKLFSYNDLYIKKIYQTKLHTYPELNKPFILNDNINQIVNNMLPNNDLFNNTEQCVDYQPTLPIQTNDSLNSISETFIKVDNTQIPEMLYSSSKLLKMTKKELEVIIQKKGLVIDVNKMLKKDIVDLILK